MLRVWFGEHEGAIYNTSIFFKNTYQDKWITDEFARKVIADIDKSEVIGGQLIRSPVLGDIPPERLSGGTKALILMRNMPHKIFNASNCGDNCAKWILELGAARDFTINLYHVMFFEQESFEIRVMNARNGKMRIAHNMQEFLDAGAHYLRKGI